MINCQFQNDRKCNRTVEHTFVSRASAAAAAAPVTIDTDWYEFYAKTLNSFSFGNRTHISTKCLWLISIECRIHHGNYHFHQIIQSVWNLLWNYRLLVIYRHFEEAENQLVICQPFIRFGIQFHVRFDLPPRNLYLIDGNLCFTNIYLIIFVLFFRFVSFTGKLKTLECYGVESKRVNGIFLFLCMFVECRVLNIFVEKYAEAKQLLGKPTIQHQSGITRTHFLSIAICLSILLFQNVLCSWFYFKNNIKLPNTSELHKITYFCQLNIRRRIKNKIIIKNSIQNYVNSI